MAESDRQERDTLSEDSGIRLALAHNGSASGARQTEQSSWAEGARELLETVLLTIIIFLLIRNVVQNFRVEGNSMEPNFSDRQFLIVNRFAYCPGLHLDVPFTNLHWQRVWCIWEPSRGDVIVFHAPDQDKDYIKRVVGLPGETIEVDKGQVLIDGQVLQEPYDTRHSTRDTGPVTLRPDELFVMGDNRPNSRDSRSWGPLTMDAVVGKAILSYWPPEEWSLVSHDSFAETKQ